MREVITLLFRQEFLTTGRRHETMSEIDFDSGLKKLEGIVQKLDAGDLTLEDSLKTFEEGIELVRLLAKKLDEAEKKIETLTQAEDGSITIEEFDPK
jgi:exodeoxyribonuclease VII small subunit